jgi:hypothetical protein
MAPFSETNQLVRDLEPLAGTPQLIHLPGQPSVLLDNSISTGKFLERELWPHDLETMAPRLWIMTTFSSANINPLHRQHVKGREIIVTEEPRLHLVWIHNRIFIKPLPRYLLSQKFWSLYLDKGSSRLGSQRDGLHRAATGFLRTYRYLIRHESDFRIAQQDHLRLVPKDVDWPQFCRFVAELQYIDDAAVTGRYCYGELRLTRLNLYAPLLLRKFHYEQVHGQYGDIFGRLYGPILFVFALISTVLNSMQVALSAEQLVDVHWEAIWYVSRWFSAISLVGAAVISVWLVSLWLWIFLDEWIFTVKRVREKKQVRRCALSLP